MMDLDVWKSELSVFVSAKNINIKSVFVFVFNMDVTWMYLNMIFNIIRIRHYTNYPTYLTLFVSTKNKVPIEAIKILFILLNTNYR
jgi:hypothetical protein